MTPTNAIIKLKALHGNVDVLNPNLFVVTENRKHVLYRIKSDVLERRVDIDNHTCRWEPVI